MSDSNNSTQILGELQQIKGSLEHFVREDSSTKRAFDTLYQELQQYKSDFLFQFEKGFLIDLLSFYDSLIWYQNVLESNTDNAEESFLSSYAEEMLLPCLLAKHWIVKIIA